MSNARFARTELMLGEKAMELLHDSRVVIVGLGAVGGYAAETLTRAGLGNIRLVDFDKVQATNINRQLYALESTIGQAKVEAARKRILDINPDCHVETMECFAHVETLEEILAGEITVVIDAIDSFNPKIELLAAARKRDLSIVSSMGAALKSDPDKIQTAALEKSHGCALARVVRKKLRQRGIPIDFTCVFSTERPTPALTSEDHHDELVLERGRKRRTLGSLPTITGIFGLRMAQAALDIILGEHFR